jgi:hypothetical protein
MQLLLEACGIVAVVIGGWRSYAMAREALGPVAHQGDPTRTALEAGRPILERTRVRLFLRRVAISLAWLLVAGYGLYLVAVGQELTS